MGHLHCEQNRFLGDRSVFGNPFKNLKTPPARFSDSLGVLEYIFAVFGQLPFRILRTSQIDSFQLTASFYQRLRHVYPNDDSSANS